MTIAQQVVRSELGVEYVVVAAPDTKMREAGSSSASRQAWMSGGAVQAASRAVRDVILDRAAAAGYGAVAELRLEQGVVTSIDGALRVPLVDLLDEPIAKEREFHHRPTQALDENGQGNAHVAFAFVAHRAVVDVDVELGLFRVVQVATGQDVGRALNPMHVIGQIEGGIAQGVGLAIMEEIVVDGGVIKNPSFTDYLIPTALDAPDVLATLIEQAEPGAPFGAKGVGEPPVISSTPAVVAAIRAATGTVRQALRVSGSDGPPSADFSAAGTSALKASGGTSLQRQRACPWP